MLIDFFKYSVLNVPTRFRTALLLEIVRVLISKPIQALFSDFVVWRSDVRHRTTITPQTCSLEMAAKTLLDANISIVELDGKPYDFLVNVSGGADVSKLSTLLNTYKLAGRSFIYELGDTVYSCKYINHVDENLVETYTCKFIEHVNEDDAVVVISVFLAKKTDGNYTIQAEATRAVASDVSLSGRILHDVGGAIRVIDAFTVIVTAGKTVGTTDVGTIPDYAVDIDVKTITPTRDSKYTYEAAF